MDVLSSRQSFLSNYLTSNVGPMVAIGWVSILCGHLNVKPSLGPESPRSTVALAVVREAKDIKVVVEQKQNS